MDNVGAASLLLATGEVDLNKLDRVCLPLVPVRRGL